MEVGEDHQRGQAGRCRTRKRRVGQDKGAQAASTYRAGRREVHSAVGTWLSLLLDESQEPSMLNMRKGSRPRLLVIAQRLKAEPHVSLTLAALTAAANLPRKGRASECLRDSAQQERIPSSHVSVVPGEWRATQVVVARCEPRLHTSASCVVW